MPAGHVAVDMEPELVRFRGGRRDPGRIHRGVEFRAPQPGGLDLVDRGDRFGRGGDRQRALRRERVLAVDDDGDLAIGREQVAGGAPLVDARARPRSRSRGCGNWSSPSRRSAAGSSRRRRAGANPTDPAAASCRGHRSPSRSAGALIDPAAPTRATLPSAIRTARSGRYLPATELNMQHMVDQRRRAVGG